MTDLTFGQATQQLLILHHKPTIRRSKSLNNFLLLFSTLLFLFSHAFNLLFLGRYLLVQAVEDFLKLVPQDGTIVIATGAR